MRIKFIQEILDEQRRDRNDNSMKRALGILDGLVYEHNDTADLFLSRCCETGIAHIEYMKGINDTPIIVRFGNGVIGHLDNVKVRPANHSAWLARGTFYDEEGEKMYTYENSQPSIATMHKFYTLMNAHIADVWLKRSIDYAQLLK